MNSLPDHIQSLIDEMAEFVSLKGDYAELSNKYRWGIHDKKLKGTKEHLAYLACRLPATYAVNVEIFRRLQKSVPFFAPNSVIDVGAGPATSLIALHDLYGTIEKAHLVERDHEFEQLGKKFLQSYSCKSSWQHEMPTAGSFDLVSSSYMLSELDVDDIEPMLKKMTALCGGYMVLIDTGTPFGCERMILARTYLIEQGYTILAPCPHQLACPMPWCHFSVRLPRSQLHRQVKGADRGYEDEKFCYLIASKESLESANASRIVRMPLKRSGHMHLTLCTPSGTLTDTVVSKKMKETYQNAKKADWGDTVSL